MQHMELRDDVADMSSTDNSGMRVMEQVRERVDNFSEVRSLLKIPENFDKPQSERLVKFLHENLDMFVTEKSPNLGFTRMIEHVSETVSFTSLQEEKFEGTPRQIAEQGNYCSISRNRGILITNPIVLVSKRSKTESNISAQDLRFCCE